MSGGFLSLNILHKRGKYRKIEPIRTHHNSPNHTKVYQSNNDATNGYDSQTVSEKQLAILPADVIGIIREYDECSETASRKRC
jgi:hypothetical protein